MYLLFCTSSFSLFLFLLFFPLFFIVLVYLVSWLLFMIFFQFLVYFIGCSVYIVSKFFVVSSKLSSPSSFVSCILAQILCGLPGGSFTTKTTKSRDVYQLQCQTHQELQTKQKDAKHSHESSTHIRHEESRIKL